MSTVTVKIKRLDKRAIVPEQASSNSAGYDLCCLDTCILEVGGRCLLGTGWALEIPPDYEGQIRPRSGLAYRQGLTVLNSPGTIDADYRGEIKILCINLGQSPITLTAGTRIAQLVIAPVISPVFQEIEKLDATVRNEGGFGSTGL